MRHAGRVEIALLLAASALFGIFTAFPEVHAVETYKVTAFPFYSQEGSTITLVLSVSGATPSTSYGFVFNIIDPNNAVCSSTEEHHDTLPGETEFGMILAFPGPEFPSLTCSQTSLVGGYRVIVNQTKPVPKSNVNPGVYFLVGITDKGSYQRTTIVSIFATAYQPFESVSVVIRTTSSLTVVLSDTIRANPAGEVIDSWKIPRNATTTEQYLVTVTGTATSKTPSDAEVISVFPAIMTIGAITASSPSYQRTQTLDFSFQATYPSGETADTGAALVTLTRPDRANTTITATFDSLRQEYVARYNTSPTNQTGTWTASLQSWAFDDGWGNPGPFLPLATSVQLQQAILSVSINVKPYFVVNEQIRFNATISYPDGSSLTTGPVYAFMSFSGGGYNYSISVIYDSGLGLWEGAYSPNNAPGGLWSLKVTGTDTAVPANLGSSTRTITLQDRPPVASFTESSTTVPTGTPISFDGSASNDPDGAIIDYSWNFGDGSSGSGATLSHAYATAGSYTVTLTVTDNSGSTAVSTAAITIQNRPPTASFTIPSSVVAGSSASFSAASSADPDGTISTYSWDFGDGSTGSGLSPNHTYSTAGSFTVKLTVTDNNGSTALATQSVTVQAPSSSNETTTFPLYLFGILAALIAALFAGGFFYFRRHRVTHANLKIDLEAVRSEAGRIESQDFFQSVKDQLKKDQEDR